MFKFKDLIEQLQKKAKIRKYRKNIRLIPNITSIDEHTVPSLCIDRPEY